MSLISQISLFSTYYNNTIEKACLSYRIVQSLTGGNF